VSDSIRADLAEEAAKILDGLRDGFHYDLRSDRAIKYVDKAEARLREILILLGESPVTAVCPRCGHRFAGGTHDPDGKGCDVVVDGNRCGCMESPP
jgi:hypothetical protein